jgi:anthranilate phosphoribosyltransferase
VILNAAASLIASESEQNPKSAAARAADAIDQGAARHLLERLIQYTNRE